MVQDEESAAAPLTIKEMAAQSGVSEHTLRYYEKIGLIEPVPRDGSSGHRRYTHDTAQVVETLSCLRASGLSIEAMRTYLRLRKRGNEAAAEQKSLFQAHRAEVAAEIRQRQTRLEFLSGKVAYWEACERGDTDEAKRIALANREIARTLYKDKGSDQ